MASDMVEVQYVCVIGTGLISRSIRLQTRFEGSHTAPFNAMSKDKQVIEALAHVPGEPLWMPGRVTIRSLADYPLDTECFWYKTKNDSFNHQAAWDFAMSTIGVPYDFKGVARFVTRKSHDVEDVVRWFCSEKTTVISRVGGDQVQYLPAWAISPKLHCCSPDHTLPKRMRIGDVLDMA